MDESAAAGTSRNKIHNDSAHDAAAAAALSNGKGEELDVIINIGPAVPSGAALQNASKQSGLASAAAEPAAMTAPAKATGSTLPFEQLCASAQLLSIIENSHLQKVL